MRLSLVFELLLIFVLLAFAASRHIADTRGSHNNGRLVANAKRKGGKGHRQNAANKYCSCSSVLCNCCRDFALPVVGLKGPGCASLQYLQGDRMAISMSFADRVVTNTTISGRKPKPVCMPLPGGVSKFCGRVYNIGRQGEDFKACLGLELRALSELEASVRVSCFKFGPEGLKVEPAQPLPVIDNEDDDDDDDDDDDEFGLVDDDDDLDLDDEDDDDDDDDPSANNADNDVDSVDYTAFSVFGDDFFGDLFDGDSGTRRKPVIKKKVAVVSTTRRPIKKVSRKPVRPPPKRRRPTKSTTVATTTKVVPTTSKPQTITISSATTAFSAVTTSKPLVTKKHKRRKTTTTTTTTTTPVTPTTQEITTTIPTTTPAEISSEMHVSDDQIQSSTARILPPVMTQTESVSVMTESNPVPLPQETIIMSEPVKEITDMLLSESQDSNMLIHQNDPLPVETTTMQLIFTTETAVSEDLKQAEISITTEAQKTDMTMLEVTTVPVTQLMTEKQLAMDTENPKIILQNKTDETTVADILSTTISSVDNEVVNDEVQKESMILKNEEVEDDASENEDDDDDTDSLTDAVDQVLGDDDDDKHHDDDDDEDEDESDDVSDDDKNNKDDKDDESDVLGEIVDEVVNTMTDEDSDENKVTTTTRSTQIPTTVIPPRAPAARGHFRTRYSRVMRLD